MARRPTIADLAEAAGVSVATVDRLLNRRHAVRESTARRIAETAEAIGFRGSGLIARHVSEGPVRTLGFLMQKRDAFYQGFAQACELATQQASGIQGRSVVGFMNELVPSNIAEHIRQMAPRVDALALVAIDHPVVNAAVDEVTAMGKPVLTLLSDLVTPGRTAYLAVDARRAGRIAGWLMARLSTRPGKVGVLIGSHRYLSHELSESSFRSYLRAEAPAFTVLEPMINLDDVRIAHEAISSLINANPDLVGIYSAGGGVEGLVSALREDDAEQQIVAICNEVTPVTRAALSDGTIDVVLNTPVGALAERAVDVMTKVLLGQKSDGIAQFLLPPEIVIRESI